MKTLKFMLAAATAIGLVSATQADQFNTTGFEKLAVGTQVTTGVEDNRSGYSYFYYAGSEAADNQSVITNGTPDIARPRGVSAVDATRNNILQVSTGTDPLLRTYAPLNGSVPQAATTLAGDVYVDTLVQFTVTPHTDNVTPGTADKLMIYLKEAVVTNEFGEVTEMTTNLVVIGGYCVNDGEFEPKEYKVTPNPKIEPNTWHRLTVKAIVNYAGIEGYRHPAFLLYLDGNSDPCSFNSLAIATDEESDTGYVAPFDDDSLDLTELDERNVVFSLKCTGSTAASLQGVGFAGEGMVDDIVFSPLNPFATVFDFTFVCSNGVSAVTYTIGGVGYNDQQRTFPEVEEGAKIAITSISYQDGWQAGSTNVVGLTGPVDGFYTLAAAGASITIIPAEAPAAADWADESQIADNTPAATQYPALAATALATADAKQLTVWAKANNVDFSTVKDDAGDYVEAFLLNCALAEVEDEKDEFVLSITFDAEGNPVVNLPDGKSYNGTLQLKGSTDLSRPWTNITPAQTENYQFFKYDLSL